MPWDQTTHPKIAMQMTAASVAQRRMGLKASIWDNEGGTSALVSNEFSRGGMAVQACPRPSGECQQVKCLRTMFAALLQTAMICFAMSWTVDSEFTLESPAMLTGESPGR